MLGFAGSLTPHNRPSLCSEPMEKILNLSENAKNNILTGQGILLLLCVILPGAKLLYKVTRCYCIKHPHSLFLH